MCEWFMVCALNRCNRAHCMAAAAAENAFLIFLFAFFFSLHISLFARFTVELIPWMFHHDSILNIVVYRITMLYELKHSRRETTHCFSHIMHIAHKHIEMHNTNTFVRLQVSFVGCLEYNFRISHFERLEIRVYFPCPLDAV